MAKVYARVALDMVSNEQSYGYVTVATSNQVTISDGTWASTYFGYGFQYAGNNIVGGVFTGYAAFYRGSVQGEAYDFAVPASLAASFVTNGQFTRLYSLILNGDDVIAGSAYNDKLAGYAGKDYILGGGGNDEIYAGDGNDIIDPGVGSNFVDGGNGVDTVKYTMRSSEFSIKTAGGVTTVASIISSDMLINVERLAFSDATLAMDVFGNAGQAYRMYQAAFDRKPDMAGLRYWIESLDNGATLEQVANGFMGSAEFMQAYGVRPSNSDLVSKLYANVLGRAGDDAGLRYWEGQLSSGVSREKVLAGFADSSENIQLTASDTFAGIWYV